MRMPSSLYIAIFSKCLPRRACLCPVRLYMFKVGLCMSDCSGLVRVCGATVFSTPCDCGLGNENLMVCVESRLFHRSEEN